MLENMIIKTDDFLDNVEQSKANHQTLALLEGAIASERPFLYSLNCTELKEDDRGFISLILYIQYRAFTRKYSMRFQYLLRMGKNQ